MEVKFHREVNHNYMMLLSRETPDPDAYENRVILANRIRGLLPCRLLYLNGDTYYSFDITSMQSLEILQGRRILSGDRFSGFFYELIETLSGMEEYLLNFDHLILTPDKIYIDPSGGKIGLVYFPAYRKDIKESLRELVEYLLAGTDPDDRRTTLLGYRVYHALQREEILPGELMGLLFGSGNKNASPEKLESSGMGKLGAAQEKYAELSDGREGGRSCAEDYYSASETETDESSFRDINFCGAAGKRSFRGRSGTERRRKNQKRKEAVSEGTLHNTAGPYRERAPRIRTGKSPVPAIAVFFAAGLLSAAVTYAFLHLELGRILTEHSDLLLRIAGACAVLALFAAAFHFAGKSRQLKPRYAGRAAYEPSAYESESFSEDISHGSFKDLREAFADQSDEIGESRKDFDRSKISEDADSEDYTCLLREEQKASEKSVRLVPEKGSEDSGELREITLREETVIIGKSGELSDRVIPKATVSRVHARIRFLEGAYFLTDLNSRNGTFLNGELLPGREEVRISAGDRISFADANYRLHMDEDKE